MGRSTITFTRGQGSSPGALANNDGISAFQFYGTKPGSFATTPCQAVFGLQDAVNKGIANDFADETPSTGTYLITTKGNTGDTLQIVVNEKVPVTTDTPTGLKAVILTGASLYVVPSASSTIALQGADIASLINANTFNTGYTASFTTATLTITARQGLGINLNSGTPLVVNITGAFAGTITQFSGGAYSAKAIWYYHVSRFFATNPNGKLWIQFTATPGSGYAEMQTLVTVSQGEPRQLGLYNFVAKTASTVTSDAGLLQVQFNATFANYSPLDILYVPNIAGIADISTLQNQQSLSTAADVNIVISQDGGAAGAQLFLNSGVSISNIGDILGTTSLAAVSQDIGEVGVFNLSNGVENNIPAFTNGTMVSAAANSLLDQLDSYRYLFCVKYTGFPGTFVNNDWTAIVQTNAYNRLSRNRTINKVERQQYLALLPLLKSRIQLNADGTMTAVTIETYNGAAEPGIEQMVKDGDLSPGNITGTALTKGVLQISPTQNVQTQGYIAITYNLLGVDIADSIQVTLQFTQNLG